MNYRILDGYSETKQAEETDKETEEFAGVITPEGI